MKKKAYIVECNFFVMACDDEEAEETVQRELRYRGVSIPRTVSHIEQDDEVAELAR